MSKISIFVLTLVLMIGVSGCVKNDSQNDKTNNEQSLQRKIEQVQKYDPWKYSTYEIKPEEVDTSDWLTYSNKEYGFTMKYPDGWDIKEKYYEDGPIFRMAVDELRESKKFLIEITSNMNWKKFPPSPGKISEIELLDQKWPIEYFEGGELEESGYYPPHVRIAVYNDKYVYRLTLLSEPRIEDYHLAGILYSFNLIK